MRLIYEGNSDLRRVYVVRSYVARRRSLPQRLVATSALYSYLVLKGRPLSLITRRFLRIARCTQFDASLALIALNRSLATLRLIHLIRLTITSKTANSGAKLTL
jgi:hypothetical protein